MSAETSEKEEISHGSSLRDEISKKFSLGKIVFKISSIKDDHTKDVGMVNTKEDYEKKLYTHQYQPFLFICDIRLRLAYLYGCLNNQFRHSQEEEFIFYWREVGTNKWEKWFSIKPYKDAIYTNVSVIDELF